MSRTFLGIDIGGSGIKAALVDVGSGALVTERYRLDTPQPATPAAVAETVSRLADGFEATGRVGIGFPAVIRDGVVGTANNIDPSFIGVDGVELFSSAVGREVALINDADAAALAEREWGRAKTVPGVVLVITFGTGIGSGLLVDGRLVPNLELGQIELDGHAPAERFFCAKARRVEELSWEEWGDRAGRFLSHVNSVFNPDLMVLGGGLAKHWERYAHRFHPHLPVAPAALGNNAGLVGAALFASR